MLAPNISITDCLLLSLSHTSVSGFIILLRIGRISDIESQIGMGLIEEVIQVAEGEQKLATEMLERKP